MSAVYNYMYSRHCSKCFHQRLNKCNKKYKGFLYNSLTFFKCCTTGRMYPVCPECQATPLASFSKKWLPSFRLKPLKEMAAHCTVSQRIALLPARHFWLPLWAEPCPPSLFHAHFNSSPSPFLSPFQSPFEALLKSVWTWYGGNKKKL